MEALSKRITDVANYQTYGRVTAVQGMLIEISGPVSEMSVGRHLDIETSADKFVRCEVVGFRDETALCMPFGLLDGVRRGCKAFLRKEVAGIAPCDEWLGRVVNGFGEPLDMNGPLAEGVVDYPLRSAPMPANTRGRVKEPIDLGVRALNSFTTCCRGQRIGIFAGSGVGKSVLMAMLARNSKADIIVIGMIGERGREVQEFIADTLGEEGLKRSVVVVATSDEPPLMRRQAAYLTLSIAEYFRDQGRDVLCLMDSVTRFSQAQREIGLAVGEPPTSRGYTPTVFSEMARLLERAGPGKPDGGTISAIFTILVEGDNMNEPIADAARGILDGHIVMRRDIAERGRFPAIDILASVSRTMPACVPDQWLPVLKRARSLMATYQDMEELIRLGAYRAGTNPEVDEAIHYHNGLEAYLSQGIQETTNFLDGYEQLAHLLEITLEYSDETPGSIE